MSAAQDRLFSGGAREPEPVTVLSFGAGQQSTALLLLCLFDEDFREEYAPGRLLTVMADTGDEHPQTYEHVEKMRSLCRERDEEFHFIEAGGPYHSEAWPDLITFYERGDRIGSKTFPKTCTANLKISTQYRFLERLLASDYALSGAGRKRAFYEFVELAGRKLDVMIGISAEETGRRLAREDAVPVWMRRTVRRLYPLAEMGWDRKRCQDFIRDTGFDLPIPSLCRRCPYKNELDVLLMSREDPQGLAEWVELERRKLAAHAGRFPDLPLAKNHGVFGPNTTLPEVLERAREEHGHLATERLRRIRMEGHGVGSKY